MLLVHHPRQVEAGAQLGRAGVEHTRVNRGQHLAAAHAVAALHAHAGEGAGHPGGHGGVLVELHPALHFEVAREALGLNSHRRHRHGRLDRGRRFGAGFEGRDFGLGFGLLLLQLGQLGLGVFGAAAGSQNGGRQGGKKKGGGAHSKNRCHAELAEASRLGW